MEWLPTMPWNPCPRSRGTGAHLPWNTHFNYISQNFDPTPAAFSTVYILVVSAVVILVEKRYRIVSLSVGR